MKDHNACHDTRTLILNKARELFLSQGYHKTSLRMIAKEVNLTTGAFYFYFQNKAEIFMAICLEGFALLLHEYRRAAAAEEHAAYRLRQILYAYRDFYLSQPAYYRLLQQAFNPAAAVDIPLELRRPLDQLSQEAFLLMETVIRQGIERGELRPVNPRSLVLYLTSVGGGLLDANDAGTISQLGLTFEKVIDEAVLLMGFGMVELPIPAELERLLS